VSSTTGSLRKLIF